MWLLDIRTPAEYKQAHLDGATLVQTPPPPLKIADRAHLRARLRRLGIPKHEPVSVYCQRGIRSHIATLLLREMGYTDVTDLGGIDSM